ncbi:MAG: EAL domain-containing protein [Rhizobacter sp.]
MNWQDFQHRWTGPGRHRLRTYLVGLVLATMLPTLVAGAFALWRTSESYREASGNRLADTARTLAYAIERDLNAKTALVQTLAAPVGGAAGIAGLQEWLDGAGLLPGAEVTSEPVTHVRLTSPTRRFTAGGLPSDTALDVADHGRASVTNLFSDPPRAAIVTRQSAGPGSAEMLLVSVVVAPQHLVELAPQDGPTPLAMLVAVTDGAGRVVARSRDAARFVGQVVPDWVKVRAHPDDHGLFEAATTEGLPVKFAFQRLAGTPGWVVVTGEPLDTFNAGWRRLQNQLLLGGSIAVVLALLLAAWVARRVLRPVAALARDAEAAAAGEAGLAGQPLGEPSTIHEFEFLRERIANAHAALHQRAEDARRNAEALAISERRHRTLAEAGALVLWRSTPDGRLIAAAGWEPLTGQPEAEALGFGWIARVHPDERGQVTGALGGIVSGDREIDVEFRLATAAGGWRWVRVRGVLIDEPGQEWVGALEDVDERRRAEAHVAHLAHHDPLTQLPNRTRLRERLVDALGHVREGARAAVLCLDLDRFKHVNDSLGHPAGDALLVAVTHRLMHVVREGDTVARMGGDEFAIVQTGLASPRDAEALAERIVHTLGAPYELNGHQVSIGASVGIVHAPSADADPDRLMACADMALYCAKQAGRGVHRTFSPEMDERLQGRRDIERELAQALARHEFEVSYEPVVNVRFGSICAYEAKVHWHHPQRGPIALAEVSGLADEIGVLRPLGDWILRQACLDAATWPGDVRVAVDITMGQLEDAAFPGIVAVALQRAGLPAGRLELEVGEHALADGAERVLDALHRLKALGVRIAIDHFGSSRSALGCLRTFPFDKVKIEESFVRQMGVDKEGDAMVRALTALCDTLGVASAASGVDAQAQLDLLSDEECVEVQGRLFGGALRASEVVRRFDEAGLRPLPPFAG